MICTKKIYFHTNIVAPYRVHQFKAIGEVFPNAVFCLNGMLVHDGENVWRDALEDDVQCRCVRIARQTDKTAGKGEAFFSPRLLWLLLTQRWGSVHVVGAGVSGVNAFMLFFSAFIGHSRLIGWSDGCTKEQSKVESVSWKRRFYNKWILSGMFVSFGWAKERELRRGVQEQRIVNQYFSCNANDYADFMEKHAHSERIRIRGKLGIDDSEILVLTVSRYLECKRLIDLARAFQWLEDAVPATAKRCHFLLIGGGLQDDFCETLSRLHFVNVHRLSPMSPGDVKSYYAAADLFALPSIGDVWGLVVNEALSSGLPVVCTEVIGSSVLIKNGWNGYKVPPKSPHDIGMRVQELIENETLRKEMGRNALLTMKDWTSSRGVEGLAEWVDRNC